MNWKQKVLEWHTRERLKNRDKIKVFPILLEKVFSMMRLSGKENILDLGCGPGLFMEKILSKYDNVLITGVDFSDEMLKMAEERLARFDDKRWTLHKIDVDEIEYHEEFDTVLSVSLICHLYDPAKCIENIHNALKSNGRVIISTPARYSLCRFKHHFLRAPVKYYTRRGVKKLLNPKFVEMSTDEFRYFDIPFCPVEGHIIGATKKESP